MAHSFFVVVRIGGAKPERAPVEREKAESHASASRARQPLICARLAERANGARFDFDLASGGRRRQASMAMPQPVDVTDRLAHYYGGNRGRPASEGGEAAPRQRSRRHGRPRERRMAADAFMLFTYTVAGLTLALQVALIAVWDLV